MWIVSEIDFVNHKSSLYSAETRSGIELQPTPMKALLSLTFGDFLLFYFMFEHSIESLKTFVDRGFT
jgi:hypothetical protein